METTTQKQERIEIRVSSYEKSLFKKAFKLSGDKTFSSYIVRNLKQVSEEVILKNDKIIASEEDRKVFLDALMNPPEPNQELLDAAFRYQDKHIF